MTTATAIPVTERDMLDLLHRRYTFDPGNGPRYVCAEQVRNAAGFAATRTCDFMALDVWPSNGLALHGFEVKTTRDDWLRELLHPDKSAPFLALCDYWWLAAPKGVAKIEELPPGWGLLTAMPDDSPRDTLFDDWLPMQPLRVAKQAPRLHPGQIGWSRSFVAALLRATARTARTAR